ncbi:DUF1800 family protein [bacterium]|nr:DUF1800 family protein [bacterium]
MNRIFLKFLLIWVLSHGPAIAILDLDGDGASDLVGLIYPDVVLDSSDLDGDGMSNLEEAIAGTNPADPLDYFEITQIVRGELSTTISWSRVAGKLYELQRWDNNLQSWTTMPVVLPEEGSVSVPASQSKGIYRIAVSDRDNDQDGLTAWEESLLGWDDENSESQSDEGFSDFVVAIRELEAEGGLTLPSGAVLEQYLPSSNEASRFLVQASFGPNEEFISRVKQKGMTGWLDEQRELPQVLTRTTMHQTGQGWSAFLWKHGWFKSALTAPDQLRQRLAYALSQILVVNTVNGTVVGDNPNTQATFYDFFIRGAFSDYRSVLEDVTYSPVMGFYLSHLQNRAGDSAVNRFPDENFAREIMQLFTIGLWELHPDGTRKLDTEGDFIPTYDNERIKEMARVFTGMSFSRDRNGQVAESFFSAPRGNDYQHPMKVWDEEHDQEEKLLVNDVVLPAGQSGEEDVQMTLDALCSHENTAPFICRRLIQRFTSSNPSPEYLSRVSRVWSANEGSLGAVIEAILLDQEARVSSPGTSPRVREPIIRLTHLIRALEGHTSGSIRVNFNEIIDKMGQYPMLAPTVFNFYLPDHMPAGEMRSADLTSPELQIASASHLVETDNYLRKVISQGLNGVSLNLAPGIELADDTEALLDHLDRLLTWGSLSVATRAAVTSALTSESNTAERVRTAIHLIVNSPDFAVLR